MAAVAALMAFYLAGVLVRGHYGTRAVVRNQTEETLRHVSVKVEPRGRRYPLPDLDMAQKVQVFAQPAGESHITLEFDDEHGHHHRELVVGYLDAGDCGGAEVTVWPNGLVESRENAVRLVCWGSWLEFFWSRLPGPLPSPITSVPASVC